MSTADIVTSYEKHLEANWTREGVRIGSTFGLNWKDVLPHVWIQDQLTADNIEEIYSKPLPSPFMGMDAQDWEQGMSRWDELMKSDLATRLVPIDDAN